MLHPSTRLTASQHSFPSQNSGITGPKGHFLGMLSALVNASFSYIGVEVVVIAASEAQNPHRSIPKAADRVTWRIGFFCAFFHSFRLIVTRS